MGAAVAAVGSISGVLDTIKNLFGGSSLPGAHTAVDAWVATIVAAPNSSAASAAWQELKCAAGDQTALPWYRTHHPEDPNPRECGFAITSGARAYAAAAVQTLSARMGPSGDLRTTALPPNGGSGPVYGVNTAGVITAQVSPSRLFLANVPLLLVLGVVIIGAVLLLRHRR